MTETELKVLSEIRERIARVETKIDSMTDVRATADLAKETANVALQSTKSAHHRLDQVDSNQTWLWRTVIAALITGAIALFWKGING